MIGVVLAAGQGCRLGRRQRLRTVRHVAVRDPARSSRSGTGRAWQISVAAGTGPPPDRILGLSRGDCPASRASAGATHRPNRGRHLPDHCSPGADWLELENHQRFERMS
jgi:hypothetical protein